jgi:hypothetical protein
VFLQPAAELPPFRLLVSEHLELLRFFTVPEFFDSRPLPFPFVQRLPHILRVAVVLVLSIDAVVIISLLVVEELEEVQIGVLEVEDAGARVEALGVARPAEGAQEKGRRDHQLAHGRVFVIGAQEGSVDDAPCIVLE